MRNVVLLLAAVALSSACMSSQMAPQRETLRSLQSISVVPIESPPLVLTPNTEKERKAILALTQADPNVGASVAARPVGAGAAMTQSAGTLTLAPPPGISAGARILTAIGGMAMLVEAASAGQQKASESGAIVLENRAGTWMPTIEFARAAAEDLAQAGHGSVRMMDGYAKLPIADRSVTWHMENWLGPIRDWYSSDVSSLDYLASAVPPGDAVIEVGVINYEYFIDHLMLQVFVRLIDPHTRRVLGRARHYQNLEIRALLPLLENDAEGVKQLVVETGDRLVAQCLADLGFSVQ